MNNGNSIGRLILCLLGYSACFLSSTEIFFKINFLEKSFSITVRVSNSIDPDQDLEFVGPDPGPDCLQRSSPDDTGKQSVNYPCPVCPKILLNGH